MMYIGSSVNVKSRLTRHIGNLRKGSHFNEHLQQSWDKHSEDTFVTYTLEETTVDKLVEAEQWWIDSYQTGDRRYGFNKAIVVRGSVTGNVSKETREKLSIASKAYIRTPEHNAKVSAALKGKKKKESTKLKISATLKGTKLSEERKKNIGLGNLGRKCVWEGKQLSEEHKRKISEGMKRKKHETRD